MVWRLLERLFLLGKQCYTRRRIQEVADAAFCLYECVLTFLGMWVR